jgi:hypothetical protein
MKNTEATTATFEAGQAHACRSASNAGITYTFQIMARTAKMVTVRDSYGKDRRCKIRTDERGEWTLPQGDHAWAPVIRAQDAR